MRSKGINTILLLLLASQCVHPVYSIDGAKSKCVKGDFPLFDLDLISQKDPFWTRWVHTNRPFWEETVCNALLHTMVLLPLRRRVLPMVLCNACARTIALVDVLFRVLIMVPKGAISGHLGPYRHIEVIREDPKSPHFGCYTLVLRVVFWYRPFWSIPKRIPNTAASTIA